MRMSMRMSMSMTGIRVILDSRGSTLTLMGGRVVSLLTSFAMEAKR